MARWKLEPIAPDENDDAKPLTSRILWFMGIALASMALVAITAYALRGLLFI